MDHNKSISIFREPDTRWKKRERSFNKRTIERDKFMLHHVKWNDFISISNSSEFLVLTRKVKNKKKIKKNLNHGIQCN